MQHEVILAAAARTRLTEALALAACWHAADVRNGTSIPYLSHLLQVSGLVLEHGGDVDAAIAGLLHDALEDARSPEERRGREEVIRERFGQAVLDIVLACTDTGADEAAGSKRPWRERKERYLAQLGQERGAALLVAACDKRHNLGAIVSDVRTQGRDYLKRFNAGASEQVWYFERVLEVLRGRGLARLEREIGELLGELRELVAERVVVAGADGCKAGWICVWRDLETGELGCGVHEDAESLLAMTPAPAVLAVDIPIGLTDAGSRTCDVAARRVLGGVRGTSVFPAPIRPALAAASHDEASRIGREADGRGVPAQAWGIYAKVHAMDEALARRSGGQRVVREVHPEVSFWALNHERAIEAPKRSPEGEKERRALIDRHFGSDALESVRAQVARRDAEADDILDAFAALWTAERIHRGTARTLPETPPCDVRGLRMEIVY